MRGFKYSVLKAAKINNKSGERHEAGDGRKNQEMPANHTNSTNEKIVIGIEWQAISDKNQKQAGGRRLESEPRIKTSARE